MGGYPEVKLENSVLVSSCHLNQSYIFAIIHKITLLFLTHHLFLFLIDVFLYVYPIIFGE